MQTIEEVARRVEVLWQEHCDAPFPREIYQKERVNGTSLVLLDSNIAGCVSTFLWHGSTLDLWRTAALGLSYRTVSLVLMSPDLVEEGRAYYTRLETMAALVLEVVGRKARETGDT